MLSTRGLTIKINNKIILNDINLDFKPGKRTAIIGPNGCGKSTLLKAISGLSRNYKGDIFLDSQNIKNWSRKKIAKKMAILPQGATTPNDLTVKELVSYGRFPYRSLFKSSDNQNDKDIIANAMAKTKVDKFASRLVSTLSGGERQRTWIAMALANNHRYCF